MLAIYLRLSRESDDSMSIENQRREAIKFAKENGFDDYFRIYNEGEGLSGGLELYKRPKFQEMLNDMRSNLITAVYTRKQERLERNTVTWGTFLSVVDKHKIKVYYSSVLQDLLTAEGRMLANIVSTTNAYAIEKQSFLTKRALHGNLEVGKSRGGIMAYGFTKDAERNVIIDEVEAEVIREIYNHCLNGKGTRAIATILNKKNIKTRYQKIGEGSIKLVHKDTGKEYYKLKSEVMWAQNTIRNILRNEIYIGRKYFGKDDERKIYNYPIIIDEATWQEVQTILTSNRKTTGKKVEHRYLLKGLLECGRCGRNYYGKINKNTNIYMCSSKRFPKINCGNRGINITQLERYVWERLFVLQDLITPLTEYLEHRKEEDKVVEIQKKISYIDNKLNEVSSKRKRAIKLVIDGVIREEEIKNNLEELERDARDLIIQKKNFESQIELFTNSKLYLEMLNVDLDTLVENTPFKRKVELAKKYIRRIVILFDNTIGYSLEIKYTFGHEVFHVIDKNYLIGLDLNSLEPLIFDDRMDGEMLFNKMIERFKLKDENEEEFFE